MQGEPRDARTTAAARQDGLSPSGLLSVAGNGQEADGMFFPAKSARRAAHAGRDAACPRQEGCRPVRAMRFMT